jgi:branched-chain amino acid transport system permease protein
MTDLAQTLVDGVALGSLYSLLALSVALVFGLLRFPNFAHGELLLVGGFTIFLLAGEPLALVFVVVIVVVVLTALAMERLAFRPVRDAEVTTLLMTAFALSFLLQSVALYAFGGRPKTVAIGTFTDGSFTLIGLHIGRLDLINIAAAAILMGGLAVFLRQSPIGTQMRAAAEDFRMARLLGVRANRVIAAAFAISGVFAAVTAFLLVAQTGTLTPEMGLAPVLVAFVANVVGGMGRLVGATVGAFVLAMATVLLQTYLPDDLRPFRDAFLYTAVIAILLVRPEGLFASKALTTRV